jgi:hypothetical protein
VPDSLGRSLGRPGQFPVPQKPPASADGWRPGATPGYGKHVAARPADTIYLPDYTWAQIQRLKRQITLAQERGWHAAASLLAIDLADTCRDFHRRLETAFRGMDARNVPRLQPTVSAIYRDLLALRQEFGEVEIDLAAREVAVTTDTIELEGVSLGDFQIRLTWSEIGHGSQPYRVVALDPHPPARRDDVTHPHVQDEKLCEGEGRPAIAAALAESRFYDFFLLVDQLLHNYGRGSAYVELDQWNGVPCSDCGAPEVAGLTP